MELKSYDELDAEQQLAYKLGAASRLTPADVLAAVRTLPGVKEIAWCSRHQVRWGYAPMCGFSTDGTCPKVPSLVVPLSELDSGAIARAALAALSDKEEE